MRIGYLLNAFPVLSETFINREIRLLAALTGFAPTVASLYRPGTLAASMSESDLARDCLYLHDIDKRRLPGITMSIGRFLSRRPLSTTAALGTRQRPGLRERVKTTLLARHFVERGVTHLHTHFAWPHLEYLEIIQALTGIPFTVTTHAADIFMDNERVPELLGAASRVLTISEFNKNYLATSLGIARERIEVVRCGIPFERFPYHSPPLRETPVILSVGRMVEKKGFDVLLRSLSLLAKKRLAFQAVIVGDGPLRLELEELALRLDLGKQVSFEGPLQPDATLELMRACDICALACKRATNGDMDGIPVVLMEAMATGRPVVATALSGIPELVTSDCGALARPDDPEDFAHALEPLLRDWGLRRELGCAGRRRVQQDYTLETQASSVLRCITNAQTHAEAGRCAS